MNGGLIIGIIPLVVELMRVVEEIILGRKKGKKKKKLVMDIVGKVINALYVSGVIKEKSNKEVINAISEIIDDAVGILNEKGIFKKGEEK